jgi:hypothetical protein
MHGSVSMSPDAIRELSRRLRSGRVEIEEKQRRAAALQERSARQAAVARERSLKGLVHAIRLQWLERSDVAEFVWYSDADTHHAFFGPGSRYDGLSQAFDVARHGDERLQSIYQLQGEGLFVKKAAFQTATCVDLARELVGILEPARVPTLDARGNTAKTCRPS